MSRRRLSLSLVTAMLAVTISSYPGTHAADANGDEYVGATQLIVRLDPATVTIDDVNMLVGTSTAAASSGIAGSYLLDIPSGADAAATATRIDAIVGVRWVAPNTTITPPEVDLARIYAWRIYAWTDGSPVPGAGQYAATAVNLAGAHQLSTGSGVIVAVLDTGVQLDPEPHPLFGSWLVPGIDLVDADALPAETRNGIDDDGDGLIDEGIGHGTHVAGIVHQVAPTAKIMPVRILDDDGSGTTWNAAEGMFWAADHGARVINMSLGTHGSPGVLRDAVRTVSAAGVLVVAAAGNDGKDRTMYPAASPEAVAVGSVGAGDVVSTFSNFGRWVDVVAPGENIHSSYAFPAGSYAINSGTSMATPWVAGEAALLFATDPSLSPAAVSAAISRGAHSLDAANPSRAGLVGAGRIDLLASLLLV
jgi:subtilisin family serine protease